MKINWELWDYAIGGKKFQAIVAPAKGFSFDSSVWLIVGVWSSFLIDILICKCCVHSTQQQGMKVEGSPYRRLVPALRTSARHRLSSVTGPEAHATTLLTSTASG